MCNIIPTIKICEKCKKRFALYSFEIREHRNLCEDCAKTLEDNYNEKEIPDPE
jgi:protein-arginine kinase activator protein McsA